MKELSHWSVLVRQSLYLSTNTPLVLDHDSWTVSIGHHDHVPCVHPSADSAPQAFPSVILISPCVATPTATPPSNASSPLKKYCPSLPASGVSASTKLPLPSPSPLKVRFCVHDDFVLPTSMILLSNGDSAEASVIVIPALSSDGVSPTPVSLVNF